MSPSATFFLLKLLIFNDVLDEITCWNCFSLMFACKQLLKHYVNLRFCCIEFDLIEFVFVYVGWENTSKNMRRPIHWSTPPIRKAILGQRRENAWLCNNGNQHGIRAINLSFFFISQRIILLTHICFCFNLARTVWLFWLFNFFCHDEYIWSCRLKHVSLIFIDSRSTHVCMTFDFALIESHINGEWPFHRVFFHSLIFSNKIIQSIDLFTPLN